MNQYIVANDRVGLRLQDRSRIHIYLSWENDPDTIVGFGSQFPQALSVREGGWDGQQRNPNYQVLEVASVEDGRPVGKTTLAVDPVVRTAELMMVIDPEQRGRGLGVAAARATLQLAFEVASLEMIWGKVLEPNRASVRMAAAVGLRLSGRLESAGWWKGRRCDELLLCLTRERYFEELTVDAHSEVG